jgi:hypothetical protein
MRYRYQFSLFFAAFLLLRTEAFAVTVIGARPCGEWLRAKAANEKTNWTRLTYESWLTGYLSGVASGSGKDALKGSTTSTIYAWMDNYCQANPAHDIDDGAIKLFRELVKHKGL